MLSYLAATLPTSTSPEARLLALQCALRADNRGQVRLLTGLLRSMRLAHDPTYWRELEHHRWLHLGPQGTGCPHDEAPTAQLVDALSQTPGSPDRLRAADWALRAISVPPLKALPASTRLTALALEAHHSPAHARTGVEADRLSRACGTTAAELGPLLDHLIEAGTISAWACDPHTEELHWTPTRPAARPVR